MSAQFIIQLQTGGFITGAYNGVLRMPVYQVITAKHFNSHQAAKRFVKTYGGQIALLFGGATILESTPHKYACEIEAQQLPIKNVTGNKS